MDLDSARRALLDLSTRNRLLALPAGNRARAVLRVVDSDPAALIAALMKDKPLTLVPAGGRRRADSIGVDLPAAELPRRLRGLALDARTAREESGVPCLFVAIGALAWRDPGTPDKERLAPICLVPVSLEPGGPGQPFRLRPTGGAVQGNECLAEKLRVTFGITLAEVDPEQASPAIWGATVAEAVAGRPGFTMRPDVLALGLFAFDRLVMWRDLDPVANPGLLQHPLLRQLLGADPAPVASPLATGDDGDIDTLIPVERLDHVVPLDGSQALAVEEVRRGRSLVIQGPPGTGKSQVITAIIAQAVLDGRSVLFLAEKQAALEVVERRMRGLGLGPALLSLHDPDTPRSTVMQSLRETLEPVPAGPEQALLLHREAIITRLGALRSRLNRHAAAMRQPVAASGIPLYVVVGALARRRAAGQPPCRIDLPGEALDAAAVTTLRGAAAELAQRALEGGARSIWHGITAKLTPPEQDRLLAALPDWLRTLSAAAAHPRLATLGPKGLSEDLSMAEAIYTAPVHDASSLNHPAWNTHPAMLAEMAQTALRMQEAMAEPSMRPGAETLDDLAEARRLLAQPAPLLGFMLPGQRRARRIARQASNTPDTPLPALDAALSVQRAMEKLSIGQDIGRGAFGALWGGPAAAMIALVEWQQAHGSKAMLALASGEMAVEPGLAKNALDAFDAMKAITGLDMHRAFGDEDPPLPVIAARLADWASAPESLPLWLGWHRAVKAAPVLLPMVALLESGEMAPETVVDTLEHAIEEALFAAALRADPTIAAFDGVAAERLVAEFRATDSTRITLARAEAVAAHARRMEEAKASPAFALLRSEMEKKRGHLPLRALFTRAAPALRLMKPILMMSPLSVARFLASPHGMTPGAGVDLLVMDEASQIEPMEALGAIGRARQVVVVGDDKQMPPTRFFQRLAEEGDEEEDEGILAPDDVESILGLMNARGMPGAMLRWHYRSRHESLIATSNAEFYENRLLVLPSPAPRSPALGLSMVRIPGHFEAGGAGVNRAEAQAIAWAVMAHARDNPGESLGVAAFSVRQRDAILDALEEARGSNPDAEPFFNAHPHEPFFVKNLENVQGDERDAMMVSIGYGPDGKGRFAMRFGPLSAQGGERRLNVLITRAKRRMVVFSSFGAEQLDLSRASGRGVAALRTFLEIAEKGVPPRMGSDGAFSPLGELLGEAILAAGQEARPRVGTAGAFLEAAAVVDGLCRLGVDTDGADWASMATARDRDAGLPSALEGMGWKLHRAWHLAWLARPAAERARLLKALGVAEPEQAAIPAPETGMSTPYREADLVLEEGVALNDVPFATLAGHVAGIVRVEQPIHRDAVAERLRLARGGASLSSAEVSAMMQALHLGGRLHGLNETGDIWRIGEPKIIPRDRRATAAHLRRPALLPPAEVEAAAQALLAIRPQTTEAELVAGIIRLLGLEETALPAITARIAGLAGSGRIKTL